MMAHLSGLRVVIDYKMNHKDEQKKADCLLYSAYLDIFGFDYKKIPSKQFFI
jgi:hypothetical protein